MTKGNVGSLLVFDASKMGANGKPSEEAVVGIITERGALKSTRLFVNTRCTMLPHRLPDQDGCAGQVVAQHQG